MHHEHNSSLWSSNSSSFKPETGGRGHGHGDSHKYYLLVTVSTKATETIAWRRGNIQPCLRVETKFLFKSRGCNPPCGFIFWSNPELKAKWKHTANLTSRLTQPSRDSINDQSVREGKALKDPLEASSQLPSCLSLILPSVWLTRGLNLHV